MGERIKENKRILVCDDEPHILRLTSLSFQKLGFEVVTATNGREAIEVLQAQTLFACVLDIMMPYIDGLEVLRAIRNNPDWANLIVIMLTVKAQDAEVSNAYEIGADLYLTKPFSQDDIERCAELISQHSR